ncbi:MAG: BON domain-containing protein [Cellvibrionales bacterium]|nr:BON domain-containing protein [Cellvibrionales bacterium]
MKKLAPQIALIFGLLLLSGGCNTVLDKVKRDQFEANPHKRSVGTRIDDQTIDTVVQHNIKKAHPDLAKAHIEVHSYNGVVLLTGEVPSEELRDLARQTAAKVRNVRQVHNETVVRGNSSMLSRTNDSVLHQKLKLKLAREEDLKGTDLDVVVRDSVVFLMGLVTEKQAEVAAHTSRLTSGVRKVVRVFEYIE